MLHFDLIFLSFCELTLKGHVLWSLFALLKSILFEFELYLTKANYFRITISNTYFEKLLKDAEYYNMRRLCSRKKLNLYCVSLQMLTWHYINMYKGCPKNNVPEKVVIVLIWLSFISERVSSNLQKKNLVS